jgi:hypothetical protein
MLASAHVAAGAVAGILGVRTPAPLIARILIAFALGVVSHMALDAIPHSDYAFLPMRLYPVVGVTETVVATGLAFLIVRKRLQVGSAIVLASGIVASLAPDVKFLARLVWPAKAATVERAGNSFHWFHAPAHPDRMIYFVIELGCMLALFAILILLARTRKNVSPRPLPR